MGCRSTCRPTAKPSRGSYYLERDARDTRLLERRFVAVREARREDAGDLDPRDEGRRVHAGDGGVDADVGVLDEPAGDVLGVEGHGQRREEPREIRRRRRAALALPAVVGDDLLLVAEPPELRQEALRVEAGLVDDLDDAPADLGAWDDAALEGLDAAVDGGGPADFGALDDAALEGLDAALATLEPPATRAEVVVVAHPRSRAAAAL